MKTFANDRVGDILQQLSNSSINAQLSWYDPEGFDYVIGNSLIGFKKTIVYKDINWLNISSVVSAMACDAAKYFPDTSFGTWYKDNC